MQVYRAKRDTRSPSKWLSLVLAVVGAIALSRTADAELVRYNGTYSSFEYNEEGGDLLGAELRIVKVRGGYEGTFQFAEGSPDHLALIKVETQGDSIRFVVPDTSDYAGEFQGKSTPREFGAR